MKLNNSIPVQYFNAAWLPGSILAAMLRLDLIHPAIQGNKWFKLKHHLTLFRQGNYQQLITFGGAYSNHIAATAAACREMGIPTAGIIRGEEPKTWSHTLQEARQAGMQLHFIDRHRYREKMHIDWLEQFPNSYIVPEGGHHPLGAAGCEEILSIEQLDNFSHITCPVGTGTTLAGLINASLPGQYTWGYSALKNAVSLDNDVKSLLKVPSRGNWQIFHGVSQGGYGKTNHELFQFMNDFYTETGIPTDMIYTGKMLMAIRDQAMSGLFPAGSSVLIIHTGGLQGNRSLPGGSLIF